MQQKTKSIIFIALTLLACGRYSKPIAPEYAAPKAITLIDSKFESGNLTLKWQGPDRDIRGKDLRSLDAYLIYRRTGADKEFELLGEVADTHLKKLQEARAQLKLEGKSGKQARVENVYEYTDRELREGTSYIYKIVAVNQRKTHGQVLELYQLTVSDGIGTLDKLAYTPESIDTSED